MSRFLVAVTCLLMTACTTWAKVETISSEELPVYRQYRIWTADSTIVLQAVRLTPDSLSGVRLSDQPGCAECRVALARAQVDSIATGKTEGIGAGIIGVAAGGVAAMMLFALAFAASGGGD